MRARIPPIPPAPSQRVLLPTPTRSKEQKTGVASSCIFYFIFIKLKATVWQQFQNRVRRLLIGVEKSERKTD